MNKLFYFLPLLLIVASCATQDTVRYTVASKTVNCEGVAPQKCLLVKRGDAANWEYFYSQIEGFSYEEGNEYVLEVKEVKNENVPADASSIKYELVKEVSKTAKTSENLPEAALNSLGEIVKYTIASKTIDCEGVAPQKCLLVKRGDATEWEYFYDAINGFTYEEGYEYELEVREIEVENVPADASSIKYELVNEISKTAKTSENMDSIGVSSQPYEWGGKVLSVEKENIGRGGAKGKMEVTVVKLEVTHSSTDKVKPRDVVYCELVSSPKVMPVVGREYVFKAKNLHPAHAKGVYFLDTDVQDLVR